MRKKDGRGNGGAKYGGSSEKIPDPASLFSSVTALQDK